MSERTLQPKGTETYYTAMKCRIAIYNQNARKYPIGERIRGGLYNQGLPECITNPRGTEENLTDKSYQRLYYIQAVPTHHH